MVPFALEGEELLQRDERDVPGVVELQAPWLSGEGPPALGCRGKVPRADVTGGWNHGCCIVGCWWKLLDCSGCIIGACG